MFCKYCGEKLPDNISVGEFCSKCGAKVEADEPVQNDVSQSLSNAQPVNNASQPASSVQTPTNTFAIVGFILGLISWLLNFWGIVGILAIIFSSLGLIKLKTTGNKGKVFAIIGLISGVCNLIYALVIIISALNYMY